MACRVFYTVNAGLYVQSDTHGLLIDGLHGTEGGFSLTPPALTAQLLARTGMFSGTVDLAFTHLHGDHFDKGLLQEFLQHRACPRVYAPEPSVSNVSTKSLAKGIECADMGDISVKAFSTVHDGAPFAHQPHRLLCLQTQGKQCVICGDAILEPLLAKWIQMFCASQTNAVFVNVYQLASESGMEFLRTLSPEHVFLYHLPFPEDDVYNYRNMAKSIAVRQGDVLGKQIQILEPMCSIVI